MAEAAIAPESTPAPPPAPPAAGGAPPAPHSAGGTPPAAVIPPAAGAPPAAAPPQAAAGVIAPVVTPPAAVPAPGDGDLPAPTWGDDWRAKMAANDDKKMKLLERYGSPAAAVDALYEMRTKLSKGEMKVVQPLKADASAAELAAWRADNGVPESPDKYDLTLPGGLVLGEADAPMATDFAKAAHAANMPESSVKAALAWWHNYNQQAVEHRENEDAAYKKTNVDELAGEWGASLNREVRIATEYFDSMPDGLGELFKAGRDSNGRLLYANAKLVRWANAQQRENNPAGTVMPGTGTNSLQALDGELDGIKKLMGDTESAYWKGPTSAKMQARYRELIEARDSHPRKR